MGTIGETYGLQALQAPVNYGQYCSRRYMVTIGDIYGLQPLQAPIEYGQLAITAHVVPSVSRLANIRLTPMGNTIWGTRYSPRTTYRGSIGAC
jgi:hypothetical protein